MAVPSPETGKAFQKAIKYCLPPHTHGVLAICNVGGESVPHDQPCTENTTAFIRPAFLFPDPDDYKPPRRALFGGTSERQAALKCIWNNVEKEVMSQR